MDGKPFWWKQPGTYCLVIKLESTCNLEVGRLGRVTFPAGGYVYIGSALGGLGARISRHLRTEKNLHWHIDYFLQHASVQAVYAILTAERIECACCQALLTSPSASSLVKGFGSSDCLCHSHLIHVATDDITLWLSQTLHNAFLSPTVLQMSISL